MLKSRFSFMLKFLICLTVVFVSVARANEPISVTISGPSKIFTGDIVTFKATTVGSTVSSYTWSASGGSGVPDNNDGSTFTLTAPSIAANITIQCIVTGSGSDPLSDSDTFGVSVVVPQITVYRESILVSNIESNNKPVPKVNIAESGNAIIYKNWMELDNERLALKISISPNDVEVQHFSLTTSDIFSLTLYDGSGIACTPLEPVEENHNPVVLIQSYSQLLNNLRVSGSLCDTGLSVKLSINNSEKLSLNYDVYGIDNDDFATVPNYSIIASTKADFPGLRDNEWSYIPKSRNLKYNCFAYAVTPSGKIGNYFFRVLKTWPINISDPIYPFDLVSYGTNGYGLVTSLDTFGNNNGCFEDDDVFKFLKSSFWGSIVSSSFSGLTSNSKIIYYSTADKSGMHVSKKSTRSEGCYPSWRMFEGKAGTEEIIIHRAEQLENGICGSITKTYE